LGHFSFEGKVVDTITEIEYLRPAAAPELSSDSGSLHEHGFLPPNARTEFTAFENPFLFPLSLLDDTSGRSVCDAATTDRVSHRDGLDGDSDCPLWWLIHSRPRQEKALTRELRDRDIPHYLPVTKCKAFTRGRPRITRAPQFPGYLFLWGNSEQRLTALKTNRIVAAHCVQNQLQLANQLWELADLIEKEVPLRIEDRLVAGQYVRVKSGLLRDKRGIILKRAGKTRLFLFINELLGGVSVEVEQHLLEPY
jgi:transcriptional antiterminator RfaH